MTNTQQTSFIEAKTRSIRELLKGVKYAIDFYQREYKWETRNITELLEDLENRFLSDFSEDHERPDVANYGPYFLGSIVICHRNGENFIIDGQQRLTSLTLLLMHIYHLRKDRREVPDVDDLIFSEQYGQKTFNINVPDRNKCMRALYEGETCDLADASASARNIVARYDDIIENFPASLEGDVLPYFVDWLLEKVRLVEIATNSDEDAYAIFETMNDRGLSLSPTDMLKGYLLANIREDDKKAEANKLWKQRILELNNTGQDEELDFFKNWLRAKYAQTMRERKRGATNQDFERIGSAFNKWVRDEKDRLKLNRSDDYEAFIHTQFNKFSDYYIRIRKAAWSLTPGLEYVYFNAQNNFTLQYPTLLAPLDANDSDSVIEQKIRLVAGYLDIFIARRAVNRRTLGYSSLTYPIFNLIKEIRGMSVSELAQHLKQRINEMHESFEGMLYFQMHHRNRRYVRQILARLTYYVDKESGQATHFEDLIASANDTKKPYEIEHIWANQYERHTDEFSSVYEFQEHRNRIGGLVLLPRGFNQSYGDKPYEEKLPRYYGQNNLLVQSLNPQCYENNPGFRRFIEESGLPFKPHEQFKLQDLDERQALYRQIAEQVWSTERFDREIATAE
jgi:uncharacterized protein with ParB-like and HNH nuclease domain